MIHSGFKANYRRDIVAPTCAVEADLDVGRGHARAAISPGVGPDLYKIAAQPRRYLVFTSAGNRNVVSSWLAGTRDFDLWVVWYAEGPDGLESGADYYLRRAGAKFQNLHYCLSRWPELFDGYEAVMVVDDDIRISPSKINALFNLRRRYDLWALQPAFSPLGKVSHGITRVHRDCELRFTDFIEMTCPLFRTDKLRDFMRQYEPELVGWGCDWWFLHTMGPDLRDRVAVIDNVVCLNPRDWYKRGGMREIDRLQSTAKRIATWQRIRAARGIFIEACGQNELRRISRSGWRRWAMLALGVVERFPVRIVGYGYRVLLWMRHRRAADVIGTTSPSPGAAPDAAIEGGRQGDGNSYLS